MADAYRARHHSDETGLGGRGGSVPGNPRGSAAGNVTARRGSGPDLNVSHVPGGPVRAADSDAMASGGRALPDLKPPPQALLRAFVLERADEYVGHQRTDEWQRTEERSESTEAIERT